MKKEQEESILTPSQKKLFKDQEHWMKDSGVEYDEERTRLDAIYDLKARFPTERKAREALDMYAGDPVVLQLYRLNLIKKRVSKKKRSKTTRKCTCK